MSINALVDLYLSQGCGRCKYHKTPECKVHRWKEELEVLRDIVLHTELVEDVKWSVPVYTFQNKNVVSVSAFKEYACISFFKGALLSDSHQILKKHGENSQTFRILKFTDVNSINRLKSVIIEYIYEAIELEKNGAKIVYKKNLEPTPIELEEKFEKSTAFKNAFYALTPGRQRGYIIYFSQAKQSATRRARIEKCVEKIMNGEGLNDRY